MGVLERQLEHLAGEERLRLALEAGEMGTWEWDIRSESVRWSEALERIHGRAPGTFPGTLEALRDEMHPDDRDRVMRAVEQTVATRSSDYAVEYRIVRPDGEVRWLAARGGVLTNDAGDPVRMLGVCWDATKRRKREARDRFLATVSPVLGGSLDPDAALNALAEVAVPEIADWCVVYLMDDEVIRPVALSHTNPELQRAVEDLVQENPPSLDAEVGTGAVVRTGEPLFLPEVTPQVVHDAARDERDRAFLDAIRLRSVIIVPLEARGERFGALLLAQSVSGRRFDGDDLGLAKKLASRASLAVDNARLFEKSEANARRLEFERARLAEVFERAPAFIAVLTGPDHVFQLANPRYRDLIGGRDVVGRPVRKALPEIEGQGYLELLDQVYRTGEAHRATAARVEVLRDPNEPPQEVFLNFVYEPLRGPEGSVSGIFVQGVDVTELVRERERAERAVQSRDEVLAFVTHDLRQPIGILETTMRALLELQLDEARRRGLLERGLRASARADRLIAQLMDVAQNDLGGLELEREKVAVEPLIELAVEAFRDLEGIELEVRVSGDLPPFLLDPHRIVRVIGNLVSNAVEYTPAGGTVTIAAEPHGGGLRFQVSDTGDGIAPEDQARVFDRYWKARDGGGMGLGLSIARDFVEAHGGRIWVESEAGKGASFFFFLPGRPSGDT